MIFLLGGNGFVGSAYARRLAAAGREFQVITRQNYAQFVGRACQTLINANGNSKKLLATRAPLEEFDASVRSVRASLVDFKFDRYVYLSTVDVYPDCSPAARTSESTPLDPAAQSAYGFHKYLAEQCVRHATPNWLILRLGGFVGPGMWKNPIHDILQGGPLWLDPASRLQFLHTDAAADMALRLVDAGCQREIFNFCGKATVSLAEVIETLGVDVSVKPGSPRAHYEVDISKLSACVDVPETREAVLRFVGERRAAKEAA